MKFIEIQQAATLSCSQKIDRLENHIGDIQNTPPGSLYYVSDIFEECAEEERAKCLETAYRISQESAILPSSDLGRGLKAIGEADIDAVAEFITQKIQSRDIETALFLSRIVPHLYRGHEDELTNQMADWYRTHSYFFFRTIERTLERFLEEREQNGDFDDELQVIQTEIEKIAEREGIEPSDSYKGRHKHNRLIKISLLLDDLEWVSKNTIDDKEIESTLGNYPNLDALLNENNSAVRDLSDHNTHPFIKLLRYDYTEKEAKAVLNDESPTPQERRDAKDSLHKIQKLSYYNHCLELIARKGQNDDPRGTLRNKLLGRPEHYSTIAEIEAINVLRREFGAPNVNIEKKAPNGKKPDVHIESGGQTIWGDVTTPRPQPSYRIARRYSVRMNPQDTEFVSEKTPFQKKLLGKINDQIAPIKDETEDTTLLIVKNEESKIDDETVQNYVLGSLGLAIPEGDSNAEPVVLRGERGVEFDDVTDHLDVLVNFSTLEDLSESPYVQGQVANLTDVDEELIDRLADAFNARKLAPP